MIGRRQASLAALAASLPAKARAQAAWPTRPIRLIVPYGPGGSADQVARLYGERLSAAAGMCPTPRPARLWRRAPSPRAPEPKQQSNLIFPKRVLPPSFLLFFCS